MNSSTGKRNGQPIYALICVILLYTGVRAVWWQSPFPLLPSFAEGVGPVQSQVRAPSMGESNFDYALSGSYTYDAGSVVRLIPVPKYIGLEPTTTFPSDGAMAHVARLSRSVSHQAMWMSAMYHGPVMDRAGNRLAIKDGYQSSLAFEGNDVANTYQEHDEPSRRRWSLDSWVFYRPDSTGVATGANEFLQATYGASQAGAVARYRLAPQSSYAPVVYVRATGALDTQNQQEIAAGVAGRPVPALPIVLAGEGRVSLQNTRTEVRPALLAYTEIPSIPLPASFRAEIYGQGGYVGGSFATAFAGGSVRVDRRVASFDLAKVRAGAGAWGGVQKDAARLDVGPTTSVEVEVGGAPIRIAADYRYRIAGNAVPRSGLAVTVSTGF